MVDLPALGQQKPGVAEWAASGTERLGSVSVFHSSRLLLMDPLLPPPTPPPTPFFSQTQKGAKTRVKQEKERGKEQREMGRWCPEVTR